MAQPVDQHAHAAAHHSHLPRYLGVWIALIVLTVLTYSIARVHLPGAWAVTVALAIALCKGSLVALFFMHLWDQAGANRLVFATSLVFVALLIGLVIADNATRFPLANPPGTAGALPVGGAELDPPVVNSQAQEP
jgi:cytochrome c oxidase subunit 4